MEAPKFKANRDVPSIFQIQHPKILGYLLECKDYLTKRAAADSSSQNGTRYGDTSDDSLYSHQVDAVLKLYKYFSSNPADRAIVNPDDRKIALIELPTGCGKSGVAVLASYVLNARRVLVITPSMIISKQLDEAYEQFLLQRGIGEAEDQAACIPRKLAIVKSEQLKADGKLPYNVISQNNLIITNAHKISDRSKVEVNKIEPKDFDLVIVDEAHHYPARTWRQLVDHFPDCKKVFLTATPFYKGEYILKDPLIKPCYELSRDKAVNRGIIRDVEFTELEGGNNKEEQLKVHNL